MTSVLSAPGSPARISRRGPGRPRNQEIDNLVLQATLELIDEEQEITASRVVERSGVSKAALYRRWPSLTTLIAAALDVGREVPPPVPPDRDLRQVIVEGFLGSTTDSAEPNFTEERFRQRIRLAMADRKLQKAYWSSHVLQRRVPIEDALRTGIKRGELRADLDAEACFDLIAGVFYYQIVVRGERVDEPATRARCRAALDVVWRGMAQG